MIRCVRLWTGDDQNSHFEEGVIELKSGPRRDWLSDKLAVASISFQETASGGAFAWHTAPVRQLVITLSGTLDFQTREGAHFLLHPGNILLAEDTVGSGHSWKLIGDSSWRRAYVVLQPGAAVPFRARELSSLMFMFWGGVVVFPLMLVYTLVSYSVFRGKIRATTVHY
jgi:quercetin dioxygenase-like cupin family protein